MIKTIKIKITNFCMNNCSFCIFHDKTEELKFHDIIKIIKAIPKIWKGQIILNGGEPTLHKDFIAITKYIRNTFPNNRFGLGTNLKLFEFQNQKTRKVFETMISNYDLLQVGCDNEHKNIEIVEKLVPVLRKNGKDVYLNCINEFSDKTIKEKLKALDNNFGSKTAFSPVLNHNEHYIFEDIKHKQLCSIRQNDILIDADGEIYFCFQQSFEKSLGNVKKKGNKELYSIFFETNIDYLYSACNKCPYYV